MVPYYGSLLSVYIGIKKWVINSVIGYIFRNRSSLLTRPLLYALYVVPYYMPSTWFLTIYPLCGSLLCTLLTRPLLYTLYVVLYYVPFSRDPYYVPFSRHPYCIPLNPTPLLYTPQSDTLTVYPPHETLRPSP